MQVLNGPDIAMTQWIHHNRRSLARLVAVALGLFAASTGMQWRCVDGNPCPYGGPAGMHRNVSRAPSQQLLPPCCRHQSVTARDQRGPLVASRAGCVLHASDRTLLVPHPTASGDASAAVLTHGPDDLVLHVVARFQPRALTRQWRPPDKGPHSGRAPPSEPRFA